MLSEKEEIIQECRGHQFPLLLLDFYNSLGARNTAKVLYERRALAEDNPISYRTLNHWETMGLIECERGGGTGWRKFNAIEHAWLLVIKELRVFGIALENIPKLKPLFFQNYHPAFYPAPLIEYYFLEAIAQRYLVYLLVFEDGMGTLVNLFEYEKALRKKCLGNHLNIELNALMQKIEVIQKLPQNFPFKAGFFEPSFFAQLREGHFDSITIRMKDGSIHLIEATQRFSKTINLSELLESGDYQDIEIKQENGQIVSLKRTLKIKK